MKRIIKFRAKTLNYDPMTMPEWAEGFYYQELHNGEMRHIITDGAHSFEVDSETIGQFTGLKDRDGNDIYEDDIILCKGKHVYEVKWTGCAFILRGKRYGGITSMFDFLQYERKIIGNTYDTPRYERVTISKK